HRRSDIPALGRRGLTPGEVVEEGARRDGAAEEVLEDGSGGALEAEGVEPAGHPRVPAEIAFGERAVERLHPGPQVGGHDRAHRVAQHVAGRANPRARATPTG